MTDAQPKTVAKLIADNGTPREQREIAHAEGSDVALSFTGKGYLVAPCGRTIRMPS